MDNTDQVIKCPNCGCILARLVKDDELFGSEYILYVFRIYIDYTTELICDCGYHTELTKQNLTELIKNVS